MGMFDTVVCQYPLPDTGLQGHAFQTKSLDSLLEHYTITVAGRLIYHAEVREMQKDESAPLGFYMQVAELWDEDTEFHGELEFHDLIEGQWYEYLAYFTHGQLGKLERLTKDERSAVVDAVQTTARSKRYAEVFKEAVKIFGDVDSARNWLWIPNTVLDDRTPLELAGSEEGAARIRALLSEVSHTES